MRHLESPLLKPFWVHFIIICHFRFKGKSITLPNFKMNLLIYAEADIKLSSFLK